MSPLMPLKNDSPSEVYKALDWEKNRQVLVMAYVQVRCANPDFSDSECLKISAMIVAEANVCIDHFVRFMEERTNTSSFPSAVAIEKGQKQ